MEMERKTLYPIIFIMLCIGGYLLYEESNDSLNEQSVPNAQVTSEEGQAASADEDQTDQDDEASGWKEYASPQGISFRYPRTVSTGETVRVLEDPEQGVVYLTYDDQATLATLRAETTLAEDGNVLGGKTFYTWKFVIGDAADDSELGAFIRKDFGEKCEYGEKHLATEDEDFAWTQEGTYSVRLGEWKDTQGNPADLGSALCPTNFAYEILYSPEKGKVVSVNLGQEPTFWEDETEMINSIRFN